MKLFVAAAAFVIFSNAFAEAQTIGEIARQERERQKSVQASATLTNTPTTISPSETIMEEAGPTKVPVAPPVVSEKPPNALEEARKDLKTAEDRVVSLQVSLNKARLDYVQKRNPEDEARLSAEINRLTKALDAAEKSVGSRRQKIKQLEDESRKSGGGS